MTLSGIAPKANKIPRHCGRNRGGQSDRLTSCVPLPLSLTLSLPLPVSLSVPCTVSTALQSNTIILIRFTLNAQQQEGQRQGRADRGRVCRNGQCGQWESIN